jgi:hypothetical protein
VNDDLLQLARRQQGLLTAEQVGDNELGDAWGEVLPAVFAPIALTVADEVLVEAVRLSLDARQQRTKLPWAFSGATAARLVGLKVPDQPMPTVVLEGSSSPEMHGVRITYARTVPPVRRIKMAPVPYVPVIIVHCAAVLSRDDLVTLVEHAVRARRSSLAELTAVCGRGVLGSRALRSVVGELRQDGRDRWARVLLRLLVAAGLPRPETERGVPAEVPLIYVDLCWWWLRLVIEVDDWESHGSRDASERDRDRDRWLWREYGVTVLRVTPRQIRDKPDKVVQDIVAAYRRAERMSAAAS